MVEENALPKRAIVEDDAAVEENTVPETDVIAVDETDVPEESSENFKNEEEKQNASDKKMDSLKRVKWKNYGVLAFTSLLLLFVIVQNYIRVQRDGMDTAQFLFYTVTVLVCAAAVSIWAVNLAIEKYVQQKEEDAIRFVNEKIDEIERNKI